MDDNPCRILIIDDSPEDREAFRRAIARGREWEYRFCETGLGEEGLRLCREMPPDCVLLDYQLPDLDGLEFLRRLRADEFPGPIVMLTGHGSEAVAVEAMKNGVHDYVVKGFNLEGLRQTVKSAIDNSQLRRQLEEKRREVERLSAERQSLVGDLMHQTAVLSEANQRKDDFLAMLGHELRNPLAPLRTMLQVLRIKGAHDPEVLRAQEVMDRQVVHLVRLVDDLLDVSRITRGRIELRKETVDVAALAEKAVEACRPAIAAQGHELTIGLPSQPIFADADPVRFDQVLCNLLNNAAKYTDPGGRVHLTVAAEGEFVVIHVLDSGLGITAELLPRVFDLFTQGARSLDRSQGGLGLGLTLVKRLVEMHGGTVQAFSDGPGRGSDFVVRLPAVAHPAGPLEEDESVGGNGIIPRCLRVLVVDDNIDAAQSLAMLLRLDGHLVRMAHDGPTALLAARDDAPEVVLLDIGLPGMDGYAVAEQLRAQTRSAQIVLIALTGYCQEAGRERSNSAGFDHHLVKPVDHGELVRVLAQKLSDPA